MVSLGLAVKCFPIRRIYSSIRNLITTIKDLNAVNVICFSSRRICDIFMKSKLTIHKCLCGMNLSYLSHSLTKKTFMSLVRRIQPRSEKALKLSLLLKRNHK